MGVTSRITILATVALMIGPAVGMGRAAAEPLFSFGEMRELQTLPDQAKQRTLGEDELLLYQNMEFYTFTTIEALLAANNATMSLGGAPLFCAPKGAFSFNDGADIAALLGTLTERLLGVVTEVGGREDHYDGRPASEALLLALRVTYPCEDEIETASAAP